MKTKTLFVIMLLLIGSHATASSVLIGNGISWTGFTVRVSPNDLVIALTAQTDGADFGVDGYLAGMELSPINTNGVLAFEQGSQNLNNWSFQNNAQLNASGPVCSGLNGTLSTSACAFAATAADRLSSASHTLSVGFLIDDPIDDSVAPPDIFGLKVRWEDLEGNTIGSFNLGELSIGGTDLPPVPLPAAAWLFASALAGLATAAWRRNREAPLVVLAS